jgi:uncharacterized membrane protein
LEILASVLSFMALVAAWLYTVKKLSTVHALLRHLLGVLVGAVAMFVVVVIFVFMGVIAPQGQAATAADMTVDPVAAMENGGHKCPPYRSV